MLRVGQNHAFIGIYGVHTREFHFVRAPQLLRKFVRAMCVSAHAYTAAHVYVCACVRACLLMET